MIIKVSHEIILIDRTESIKRSKMLNKDIQKTLKAPVDHWGLFICEGIIGVVFPDIMIPPLLSQSLCAPLARVTGCARGQESCLECWPQSSLHIVTHLPACVPSSVSLSGHSYTLLHYRHSRLLVLGKCPDIP